MHFCQQYFQCYRIELNMDQLLRFNSLLSNLILMTEPEKKLTIAEQYNENDFIDAKDNQGDWRVGYIVGKYDFSKTFKVRFDGWQSKYDETYKFNSFKLKPFRSAILGYTGQVHNPGIRQSWKFSQADHLQRLNKFKKFIQDISKSTVHEMNQLLRGHNYFYTDFLMTIKDHDPKSLDLAIKYFDLNISFLCHYLKHIYKNFDQFIEVISVWEDIQQQTVRTAFFRAFYQVFDTSYIISGNYLRLFVFFRDNGPLIKEYFKDTSKRDAKKVYQLAITSQFINQKGLDYIQQIVNKMLKSSISIPFLFLHSLVHLLQGMITVICTEDKQQIIEKLISIAEKNIAGLKDSDYKDLDEYKVSSFLTVIITLCSKTRHQATVFDWSNQLQLELCLKLIGCPFFQKKLKGISLIISICERSEYLTKSGLLKKWIQKVKLVQVLFISDNQQFIKKSCELVKFLFIKNQINQQNIDYIWSSRVGKHQTVIKQIYNLISEFPLYQQDMTVKLQLFKKIASVPKQEWDEDYIKMIKEMSDNSYGIFVREKLEEAFGFQMIYDYTVQHQTQFGLNLLISLMHRIQNSSLHMPFQQKCFKSIKEKHKPQIHMKILLMMCQSKLQFFDKIQLDLMSIVTDFLVDNAQSVNQKVINQGFDLLGQIYKTSTKQLEYQQIIKIWNSYIVSSNKQNLMKWVFKKKDNGKVTLNQVFNQDLRCNLLQNLWNKPEDIKSLDEDQAVFFVQLFKSVNVLRQKIRRLGIVIRPLSFELDYYQKIWTLLRETTQKQAISILCQFLAQIHSCYQHQDYKISIQNLINLVVESINNALDEQNIDFITKLLLLTQKLIERDEEIFPHKFIPKVSYMRQYTVNNKQKSEEKVFRFNCMGHFYDFKKLLSQKYQIPLHRLTVLNNKQQPVKLQSYFKSMNQNHFLAAKFQVFANYQKQSQVKTYLNCQLQLFFRLLDDNRIQKMVWSIVEKLPISQELKIKIIQTQNILQQLQHVGFYKELYELKVVLQLPQQWWQKFVTSDNLNRLIANLSKVTLKTHIQLEYLATLTQIIDKMLDINNKQQSQINVPNELFDSILTRIDKILSNIEKKGSKSLQLQIKIIKNMFQIGYCLKEVKGVQPIYKSLLKSDNTVQFFIRGLITMPQMQVRKTFSDNLMLIISEDSYQQKWLILLEISLIKLLDLVVDSQAKNNLKQYFQFTSKFLQTVPQRQLQSFATTIGKNLSQRLFELIRKQRSQSLKSTQNVCLIGFLSILKHFATFQTSQVQQQISKYILFQCLFSYQDSKCKSKKAREQSFQLLKVLSSNNSHIMQLFCQFLMDLHKHANWRTRRLDDWTITLFDKMKSSTGYVGLKNLGCICYMNSFMQQLYMIPDFSQSIMCTENPLFDRGQTHQDVLFQLQNIFLNLNQSDKKFYNPKDFCYAFKDYDGNPTNVTQQMDIDQFSNILFDRLETQLKQTNSPTLIKDTFGGVFSNQIVCKGCPHYSQTEQHFLSISLTVKNKKNIYQSFDTMIKGDTLDGDNAYFCQRCSKKVSAVKRVSLKSLPDHLIITLKRFQFDYEKMMKLKVNDFCEFPKNLNLKEYSRQYLRKQESTKILDQQEDQSNDYFNYVLKGVVVHSGYADSGHYYSFIQQRNSQRWFQFNDTLVRDFNIQDLAQQAFGGQIGGYEVKQKIKNAYMLIYERQKKLSPRSNVPGPLAQILKKPINQLIMQDITRENKQHKIQNILFSAQYIKFVSSLLDDLETYDSETRLAVLKFGITVYLTVVLREKADTKMHSMLHKIHSKLQLVPELKEWVVSLFSQLPIFQQFFKNNIIRQVKKTLAYWLIDLYSSCSRDCQDYFCNTILHKITQDNQNVLEYCLILYNLAVLHPRTLDYLTNKNVVGRMLENIVRKDPRVYTQRLELLPASASEIGSQIIIQRTKRQLQSNKFKFDNQNGYIWGLINLILKRSQELPAEQYLSKTQLSYIYLNDTKIYKILEETRSKHQMHEFTSLISHLTQGNQEFLQMILLNCAAGIKDFQSKRYRQFFTLFEKLIQVEDEFRAARLISFAKIIESVKHNQQYSLDSNIIQQWLVIVINRHHQLRKHLVQQQEFLQYLHLLAKKKTPSDEIARKNAVFGEFMVNAYHGVKFPCSKKGYLRLADEIAAFYQHMLDNKLQEFQPASSWPSNPETTNPVWQVGSSVAYFDIKDKIEYQEGLIKSVFLGRVQLQLKRKTIFVWKDDQKLTTDVSMMVSAQVQEQLNSSRTTEMEIEEDEDLYDDI